MSADHECFLTVVVDSVGETKLPPNCRVAINQTQLDAMLSTTNPEVERLRRDLATARSALAGLVTFIETLTRMEHKPEFCPGCHYTTQRCDERIIDCTGRRARQALATLTPATWEPTT